MIDLDAAYDAWRRHDPAARASAVVSQREAFKAGWLARDRIARIEASASVESDNIAGDDEGLPDV